MAGVQVRDQRRGATRGTVGALQDLPFRLLVALLERPGDVVTHAEVITLLWVYRSVPTIDGCDLLALTGLQPSPFNLQPSAIYS